MPTSTVNRYPDQGRIVTVVTEMKPQDEYGDYEEQETMQPSLGGETPAEENVEADGDVDDEEEDFGDDFDDFEEGAEHDDFGDFDEASVHENPIETPSSNPKFQSPLPTAEPQKVSD